MRWRPPTRLLILIALLLLAGAVVNVAVAWGVSLWGSVAWEQDRSVQEPFPAISGAAQWPSCNTIVQSGGFGFDEAMYLASGQLNDAFEADQWQLEVHRAGWPMRALRWYDGRFMATDWRGPGDPDPSNYVVLEQPRFIRASSIPIRDVRIASHPVDLPIEPLPAGFAINTLFYAIIVGAILALPLSVFPIRHRLRARRGRCPKCGYDLAGLAGAEKGAEGAAPCPECGASR